MKNFRLELLGLTSAFLFANVCAAQVLVDHQAITGGGKFDITPVVSFSEIEYEGDGGGDVEVERAIFGLSGGYGLQPELDLYGELGYIAESKLSEGGDDGDGFILGSGIRGLFFRQDKFSLKGFGGVRYINEDYGDDIEGKIFELHLGAVGRLQVASGFGIYLGLDLVPFSDGEVEAGRFDGDLERDDVLGLRAGADYQLSNAITVNGEIALISEEAFILRLTLPLS